MHTSRRVLFLFSFFKMQLFKVVFSKGMKYIQLKFPNIEDDLRNG